jgi:hypothetical protein
MKLGNLAASFRLGLLTPSRIYRGNDLVWQSVDPDAADYFARITAAGSSISPSNQAAVNAFVLGCKADGIWSAIKASCLLAGPDSLAGALVPLVGGNYTNFGFLPVNYSRTLGLTSTGGKYLLTPRYQNDDPKDDQHLAGGMTAIYEGAAAVAVGTVVATGATCFRWSGTAMRSDSRGALSAERPYSSGFLGISRSSSASFDSLFASEATLTNVSGTSNESIGNDRLGIAANGIGTVPCAGRYTFFSAGRSLNLLQLRSRFSTYIASLT